MKAGDQIPIKGLEALVVSSDGKLLAKPLSGGGPNPLCADAEQKAARRAGKSEHGRHAADLRQIQDARSDRSRLGEGDGAGVPGEQARHGDAVSDRPPRSVRRSGSAGVAGRDPASGRRREQRPAEGPRAGGQHGEIRSRPRAGRRRRTSEMVTRGSRSFRESRASGRDIFRCSTRTRATTRRKT